MMPPAGKAIYFAPGVGAYSHSGGPVEWAKSIGCSWAVAHGDYSELLLRDFARSFGGGKRVYLYRGPQHFTPSTWRASCRDLGNRVRALGLGGVVVDPEYAAAWRRAGRPEALAFAAELRAMRGRGIDIGVTSFPSWPYISDVLRVSGAWGSVQIYDIKDGVDRYGANERARWFSMWKSLPRGGVCPSVAGPGWARGAAAYRAYLASFGKVHSAIGWTMAPARANDARAAVWRAWKVGPSPLVRTAMVAIAVSAAVAAGALAR